MGGGLMQLVAYGAQDIYLTGNPQITFFKVVYRRHTNFSMECIQQTINGSSQLSAGSTSNGTVTISRNGDLVGKMYLRCDQDNTDGVAGDLLVQDVTIEIGGQQIDKHHQDWLQVWAELTTPESKAAGYKYLTGGFSNTLVTGGGTSQQSIMVPLQFWFNRNPGLALPLIALQYHEVKVKVTFNSSNGRARDNGNYGTQPTVELWADYFYLDTDERRRFAQVSHEYLIEQLQYQTENRSVTSYKLNFNHPVKEIVWTGFEAAAGATNPFTSQKAKLTLNGHDRMAPQDREYFQLRQPLDHHTAVPGFNIKETERPVMLAAPVTLSALNFQVLAGDDETALSATLSEDNDIAQGAMDVLTDAAVLVESTTNAITIRQADAAATTFFVGDVISLSHLAAATDANHSRNTDLYTVQSILVNTAEVGASTFTSLTLDRALNLPEAITENDDAELRVIARTQNPQSRCSQLNQSINVYSFALKPEEHQPSGTCNFSRIDTAHLVFDSATQVQRVYAVNYNVLRIMSGMGGLAYSN